MLARTASSILLSATVLGLTGCKDPFAFEEPLDTPQTLGGVSIPATSLDNGRQMYVRHCRACHGQTGDGRGPAAPGLRPAPRDLTKARYKFTRMAGGDLPTDEALYEIISEGLHGTGMLPWGDIQEDALMDIIHYIKTFSPEGEGWRDPEAEVGTALEVTEDPWAGQEEAAIAMGKKVFHGKATCQSCHPAFATRAYQEKAMKEYGMPVTFRDDMYYAQIQVSTYAVNGVDQTQKPPDYTWDMVRTLSGSTDPVRDLYRIIGAGVTDTAMAAYKEQLEDKELWAVSHYVNSLVAKRDTPAARELKDGLAKAEAGWQKEAAAKKAAAAALEAAAAAAGDAADKGDKDE